MPRWEEENPYFFVVLKSGCQVLKKQFSSADKVSISILEINIKQTHHRLCTLHWHVSWTYSDAVFLTMAVDCLCEH